MLSMNAIMKIWKIIFFSPRHVFLQQKLWLLRKCMHHFCKWNDFHIFILQFPCFFQHSLIEMILCTEITVIKISLTFIFHRSHNARKWRLWILNFSHLHKFISRKIQQYVMSFFNLLHYLYWMIECLRKKEKKNCPIFSARFHHFQKIQYMILA